MSWRLPVFKARWTRAGTFAFLAAAIVSAVAAASPAAAAPRLVVESVVLGEEFGHGGRCFVGGSVLSMSGEGFAPGRVVRVGRERVRAGRDGRFGFQLTVHEPRRAQQRVTLRARQTIRAHGRTRVLRASLRYWKALEGVVVPGWNAGNAEAAGVPGKVEHARLGGFDHAVGRHLYVHYLLDGRQVFSQRIARLRGPCGAADFRLVQFPFRPLVEGRYRVDFGTRPTVDPAAGAGYPVVRLGPPPPPLPAAMALLFTVAGNGTTTPAIDGSAATASGLQRGARVSARPGGGFFVTDRGSVRAVDAAGRISTVAGTGRPGAGGDGGPARMAGVVPSAVEALPGGGFVIGHCDPAPLTAVYTPGRIRRVDANGTITTIAGTGRKGPPPRDGTQARSANLTCPNDVAPTADGGVVFAEAGRVRAVGLDGILRHLAGTGEYPDGADGGPARRTDLDPDDLAVLADGSVLIADGVACHVYRLANDRLTVLAGDGSEGRRSDDGALAVEASVCPTAVTAAPGGGFYVVDNGFSRATGSEPRLRLVGADGRIVTIAGTGRFSSEPSRGEELRGDGMLATRADLQHLSDVAVLADRGVIFTEGNFDGRRPPGLVRYLAPAAGGMLAVGVRRDRDRIFDSGRPAFTTVSLSAPTELTLTVKRAQTTVTTVTRAFPAGDTRVELPALAKTPHIVSVSARDGAGRVAEDRAAILPRGWLAEKLARSLASALLFTATDAATSSGDGIKRCHRLGSARIDCSLNPGHRCTAVLTVRLGSDRRLRWGTYRCPIARTRQLRKPLQTLRKKHFTCETSETSCPPPLFGRVADRWLVPWD